MPKRKVSMPKTAKGRFTTKERSRYGNGGKIR